MMLVLLLTGIPVVGEASAGVGGQEGCQTISMSLKRLYGSKEARSGGSWNLRGGCAHARGQAQIHVKWWLSVASSVQLL